LSFEEPPQSDDGGGEAEVGPASGDTGVEAEAPSEDAPQEPSRQYVEVDDPDNRYVRVKIHGEDVEVPFSEAVRGYSREADYTRKAQEVAQQRQEAEFGLRLQQALQSNPEMTLQILAQQYGLSLAQAQEMVDEQESEDEYGDPLEREIIYERQARLALEDRVSQREADEQLYSAVAGLRNQFNLNDEDLTAVVGTAYQMGLGVDAFPMIYKTMQFDRIDARVRAHRAEQARQQVETQRRQQAKTQAGQTISNGTGRGSGLTNQVDAGGRMTLREAIEAAFQQAERG
jgi:hypothetical protein